MNRISWVGRAAAAALVLAPVQGAAQTFATESPVLRAIWNVGTRDSQLERLAQTLLDSIGPRLTGTPQQKLASDWAIAQYRAWGIPARAEQYGTWRGWSRGITHVDLVEPRVRSLEGTMLAWSPGTGGRPVQAPAVVLPDVQTKEEFEAWLPQARGKHVLVSFPQPTCRPDDSWARWATEETLERMLRERAAAAQAWTQRVARTGLTTRTLPARLEEAGAVGVIASNWSAGWGVNKVFQARTTRVPHLDLSCEDYGLVYRLAANGQGPVLRVAAESQDLGEVPVFNIIAEIRGREKPNEYVVLSAHFDSWDGAPGATDNGTGTVTMMEAMRILKEVYPNPKRTILVGHWNGEEQGLNGSRAFAADNPKVVRGLQVLLNQDNGTGRVAAISMMGFADAEPYFGRWLARIPTEITRHITLEAPGTPSSGGSDHASFLCHGAPAFALSSLNWDYTNYTWHTNRDTYDKISFDDVRNNAILTAMLAYLASEEPTRIPRDRRVVSPANARGAPGAWPTCRQPARASSQSDR
ncbi:MAG TPA: M20/M25/M40 family metallo-hydrolase [Longimicrobiaceae bacterium]|nr:M20/M25/M40 family metallo-hydrolase [Longimicrobiaceae bacterium]